MLFYLIYIIGAFAICSLLSLLTFIWWSEYVNKKAIGEPLRIVYKTTSKGATLWRNTHPAYWKYVKMKRGSIIVMPSNCWIEVNPKDAKPVTFLHELGHLQVDIAWLTLEGNLYHQIVRAACSDLGMEAALEFMAWGVASQIGEINKEWLMEFMIQLYENLYGKAKVRTALMIAVSTPLTKHSVVHSTRRIMKVLYM